VIQQQDVITPAYRATQAALHLLPNGYGGKGDKWAKAVRDLVRRYDATSVLDYGCGQGALCRALRTELAKEGRIETLRIAEYDPAIDGKEGLPYFADLVVCTDVLEHVEPALLANVLGHLRALAKKAVFVVIATRPSNKTLPDGRNAHLILEDAAWWTARLERAGFTFDSDPPHSPLAKPSRELVAVLRP